MYRPLIAVFMLLGAEGAAFGQAGLKKCKKSRLESAGTRSSTSSYWLCRSAGAPITLLSNAAVWRGQTKFEPSLVTVSWQ